MEDVRLGRESPQQSGMGRPRGAELVLQHIPRREVGGLQVEISTAVCSEAELAYAVRGAEFLQEVDRGGFERRRHFLVQEVEVDVVGAERTAAGSEGCLQLGAADPTLRRRWADRR